MLTRTTITQTDVYSGMSSVNLTELKRVIDEWLDTPKKVGGYDPLTEQFESADDETYCPKSTIVDELIEEIQSEFEHATGLVLEHVDHWVHIHHHNMSTDLHNHYPYDVSGVFYLTVPEGSGSIVFLPSDNKYHPRRIPYPPKEGMFLLFPAVLDHTVTRHQSNDKRISISFNCKIINQD